MAPPAEPEGDERTRFIPRLCLEDGQELMLNAAYVFGRAPVPPPTRPDARPVPVDDPLRSISKTHVLVEPAAGGAHVTDLHSTNGVRLIGPDGTETTLVPGVSTAAAARTRIRWGSLTIAIDL